jgi:RNA polymerase sigma factor (sigma-70 family)
VASDAELIGWSLAGDGDAFVEVIRRHQGAVWAYLVRRVGRELAEDLLSEVWVAALHSRSSYDRSFPEARPWLFGIARNVLRGRSLSRSPEDATDDWADLLQGFDPWPAIDERIDGAAILRRVVQGLAEEQRDVLLLVVWEQLTAAEAARALGIPAGTARYRLHQARVALRASSGIWTLLTQFKVAKEESK